MSEAITTGEGTAAYDAAKNSPTRSAFMYFPTNSRRELTPYTRREIVKKGRAFEANCAFATRIRQKFARHAVGSGARPRRHPRHGRAAARGGLDLVGDPSAADGVEDQVEGDRGRGGGEGQNQ